MMYLIVNTFDFPTWLERERLKRDLSYAKFGVLCGGLSAGYMNNLEKGAHEPTDESLEKIARGVGVEPDWLIAQVDASRPATQQQLDRLARHAPESLREALATIDEALDKFGELAEAGTATKRQAQAASDLIDMRLQASELTREEDRKAPDPARLAKAQGVIADITTKKPRKPKATPEGSEGDRIWDVGAGNPRPNTD